MTEVILTPAFSLLVLAHIIVGIYSISRLLMEFVSQDGWFHLDVTVLRMEDFSPTDVSNLSKAKTWELKKKKRERKNKRKGDRVK